MRRRLYRRVRRFILRWKYTLSASLAAAGLAAWAFLAGHAAEGCFFVLCLTPVAYALGNACLSRWRRRRTARRRYQAR